MNGSLFWFSMGAVFVLVAAAFTTFARDRGWRLTWWSGLLAAVWYAVLCLSIFSWGTLVGEGEGDAGFKLFLVGLFVSIVLGVGLLRVLTRGRSTS